MKKACKTYVLAAAALALSAGAAFAVSPLRVLGFGPPVSGDASLDFSIGILTQTIACTARPKAMCSNWRWPRRQKRRSKMWLWRQIQYTEAALPPSITTRR